MILFYYPVSSFQTK